VVRLSATVLAAGSAPASERRALRGHWPIFSRIKARRRAMRV
jgi:hypothetical protein